MEIAAWPHNQSGQGAALPFRATIIVMPRLHWQLGLEPTPVHSVSETIVTGFHNWLGGHTYLPTCLQHLQPNQNWAMQLTQGMTLEHLALVNRKDCTIGPIGHLLNKPTYLKHNWSFKYIETIQIVRQNEETEEYVPKEQAYDKIPEKKN